MTDRKTLGNPPEKQEFSDFVDLNLPSGTLWKNANEAEKKL